MNKRYLKVLDADNRSCNGGSTGLEWSLPVQNADGSWTPGKWMPEVTGDLELCANGYHLTDTEHLLDWLNATIYEAEPSEERIESDDKIVCRSVRLLRKMHWDDRVARLFACDCAERVLPIYEKDYPKDKRPRQAIEVARRYAEGKASDSELAAARDAALAAAGDAKRDAARAAAGAAARDAARAAAWAAAWAAAGDKEHKWQVKRLMWYLGDECGKVIKGQSVATVEELRGLLRQYLLDIEDTQHRDMTDEAIDSLIAAAREDERKKIRNKAECLQRNFDARESKYFYGERQDNGDIDVMATEDCYILPASVLAPKEGTITNH